MDFDELLSELIALGALLAQLASLYSDDPVLQSAYDCRRVHVHTLLTETRRNLAKLGAFN